MFIRTDPPQIFAINLKRLFTALQNLHLTLDEATQRNQNAHLK